MKVDELLYADDTICITQDEEAMGILLETIETEGTYYGLKTNRSECEYLSFGTALPVHVADGTPVGHKTEVRYLGCNSNDKGDPAKEITNIIGECMATLRT